MRSCSRARDTASCEGQAPSRDAAAWRPGQAARGNTSAVTNRHTVNWARQAAWQSNRNGQRGAARRRTIRDLKRYASDRTYNDEMELTLVVVDVIVCG